MFDPPRSSQWFVSDGGKLSGPFTAARVENLVKWGRVTDGAYICDDAGSAWLPIRRSVFASLLGETPKAPPKLAPGARGGLFPMTLLVAALIAALWQSFGPLG
jgi:hypothetical protein